MTKKELISMLGEVPEDAEIVGIIDDSPEHLDELEEGSVLDIVSAGDFVAGLHVLRMNPR